MDYTPARQQSPNLRLTTRCGSDANGLRKPGAARKRVDSNIPAGVTGRPRGSAPDGRHVLALGAFVEGCAEG